MAATNINVVVVSGNLTADPDLRETSNGTSVCELRLANNVPIKKDGKWESKPNYFQVNCWGAQGENCAKYLEKGSPITVDGRLEWQMWEGKEGKTNSRVVIVADNIQFGRKVERKGSGTSKSDPPADEPPKADGEQKEIKSEDDIPF
jgi:single-strand DNA-binding protein